MLSIKNFIHTRLRDDATIRTLTGGASPHYNVFHDHPLASIDFSTLSAVIYNEQPSLLQTNAKPIEIRDEFYLITGIGANFESIMERVHELFHNLEPEDLTDTDRKILKIQFDWASPDLYDEEKNIWQKQHRYKVTVSVPLTR